MRSLNSKISFCGNIIIEYTLHLKSVSIDSNMLYAPINSKLQLTFPPPAYPGHLNVYRAQGGGNLNVVLKGGEFELDLGISQCCAVIRP